MNLYITNKNTKRILEYQIKMKSAKYRDEKLKYFIKLCKEIKFKLNGRKPDDSILAIIKRISERENKMNSTKSA